MAMPALNPRRWTVDDVHAIPDDGNRYESIDGQLFVTPAPAARHQRALMLLAFALRQYVEFEQHLGWVWIAPSDLVLGHDTVVQPDVRVHSAGPGASASERSARALVISEILSPSTARLDRDRKRRLYLQSAADRYWIVDLDAEIVEVWTPDDEHPEVLAETLIWHPRGASAPFRLALPTFFADANSWSESDGSR